MCEISQNIFFSFCKMIEPASFTHLPRKKKWLTSNIHLFFVNKDIDFFFPNIKLPIILFLMVDFAISVLKIIQTFGGGGVKEKLILFFLTRGFRF